MNYIGTLCKWIPTTNKNILLCDHLSKRLFWKIPISDSAFSGTKRLEFDTIRRHPVDECKEKYFLHYAITLSYVIEKHVLQINMFMNSCKYNVSYLFQHIIHELLHMFWYCNAHTQNSKGMSLCQIILPANIICIFLQSTFEQSFSAIFAYEH